MAIDLSAIFVKDELCRDHTDLQVKSDLALFFNIHKADVVAWLFFCYFVKQLSHDFTALAAL